MEYPGGRFPVVADHRLTRCARSPRAVWPARRNNYLNCERRRLRGGAAGIGKTEAGGEENRMEIRVDRYGNERDNKSSQPPFRSVPRPSWNGAKWYGNRKAARVPALFDAFGARTTCPRPCYPRPTAAPPPRRTVFRRNFEGAKVPCNDGNDSSNSFLPFREFARLPECFSCNDNSIPLESARAGNRAPMNR